MVVDTNDKLFDLLNEWSNKVLEPTSNVGDTKQYVNQLYKILPLFINQSIIFSDTVLTKDSSWETLKPNTIHYFNDLGGEGTPDSSMVKRQAGYLLYINSAVTDKGLQICVTEDLNVLFRVAPKGTWVMNATNLSVKQLNDKINDFAEQINEAGLNSLSLRIEALAGKINNLSGDKLQSIASNLNDLETIIKQKQDVYDAIQTITDFYNDNPITVYSDGNELLAPTIAGEGNDKSITVAIGDPNISNVAQYQVEISTDEVKWSINTLADKIETINNLVNTTTYFVRAKIVSNDSSIIDDSNYSDEIKVVVGANLNNKTPSIPEIKKYKRTTKVVRPSDIFSLKSDVTKAIDTINKEKSSVGYVDTGLGNLQTKIDKLETLADQKASLWDGTQAEYDALGTYSDNTLYLIHVKTV